MVIIDAYNVLHAAADIGEFHKYSNINDLCDGIRGSPWAGTAGGVILVCDGLRRLSEPDADPIAGVRVVFAGAGKDADSRIEAMLEELDRRGVSRGVTVVSSDRRIKTAARGARSRAISSLDFLATLPQRGSSGRGRGAGSSTRTTDVREWVRRQKRPTKPGSGGAGGGEVEVTDPLIAAALEEWAGRLRLDDLDMQKWLGPEVGGEKPPPATSSEPPSDPPPLRDRPSDQRPKPRRGKP